MDVLTPQQRQKAMSHNRGKDTKPEVKLRKSLWREGVRYRKNYKKLPGRPDIAITRYRVAVFVDGEFWHGKGYDGQGYERHKYASLKEQLEHGSNPDYWIPKIERNIQRDREVDAELVGMGWTVVHFWSKDVMRDCDACVLQVKGILELKRSDINSATEASHEENVSASAK